MNSKSKSNSRSLPDSDRFISSESDCFCFIPTPDGNSVVYAIGVQTTHYAGMRPVVDYYIDDIANHRRYAIAPERLIALDSSLFTSSSPIFAFSPDFFSVITYPGVSIPLQIPVEAAHSSILTMKHFLKRHAASFKVSCILQTPKNK